MNAAPILSFMAAQRFGVHAFRPGQRELISAVLAGQDALGILPTGGGKSLTYGVPALLLDRPVVVVSPLIALMRDQCDHLARARVAAAELDSTLARPEVRAREAAIRRGESPIIYVTPERVATPACQEMLAARGVGLLAIDEAHCVAQWGHDFRPAYLELARVRARLGDPPMLALTATATPETAAEIAASLGLRAPCVIRTPLGRENLRFEVLRTVNEMAKRTALMQLLDEEPGLGIVYTATVKAADALFAWMAALRIPVARYHARMRPEDREASRTQFMSGAVRVLVATKAFGMGVDKEDVRWVVHYQVPDSIESYWQEAGRAGRDGKSARCVLLFRLEDARVQSFFIARKYPSEQQLARVAGVTGSAREISDATGIGEKRVRGILAHPEGGWDARRGRDRERLARMMRYGEEVRCRGRALREYFGEAAMRDCGRCDVCCGGG